jgi:phosphoglycolate phosphatase-like HAD superfamily hydrolase
MIFDFDGTLADTVPVCTAAFRETLLEMTGEHYSDAQVVALFGPSEEGIFQRVLGDRWEEAMERYLDAYERHHDQCAASFPGIEELLTRLDERGVRLAVVTGKGAGSAAISVRRLGLARHFDRIVSGSAKGIVKAEQIREIADGWGIPLAQIAYVGDAAYDVIDSRKAGVVPIAAAWAATADLDSLRQSEPLHLFTSVEQLSAWCDEQSYG